MSNPKCLKGGGAEARCVYIKGGLGEIYKITP